jgi:hypothetical protein
LASFLVLEIVAARASRRGRELSIAALPGIVGLTPASYDAAVRHQLPEQLAGVVATMVQ